MTIYGTCKLANAYDPPVFQCLDNAAERLEEAIQALNAAQFELLSGEARNTLETLIQRLDSIYTQILILQEREA